MKFHYKILLLIISLLFVSCDKQYAKRLAGDYNCSIHGESWSMGAGPSDTIFNEIITLTKDENKIKIFNYSILVDELRGGKEYREEISGGYFTLKINDNVLNYYRTSRGQGGGRKTTIVGTQE